MPAHTLLLPVVVITVHCNKIKMTENEDSQCRLINSHNSLSQAKILRKERQKKLDRNVL